MWPSTSYMLRMHLNFELLFWPKSHTVSPQLLHFWRTLLIGSVIIVTHAIRCSIVYWTGFWNALAWMMDQVYTFFEMAPLVWVVVEGFKAKQKHANRWMFWQVLRAHLFLYQSPCSLVAFVLYSIRIGFTCWERKSSLPPRSSTLGKQVKTGWDLRKLVTRSIRIASVTIRINCQVLKLVQGCPVQRLLLKRSKCPMLGQLGQTQLTGL